MCGLVGISSRYITDKHHDIFRQMLVCSTVRGQHSAGAAMIAMPWKQRDRVAEYWLAKSVGSPFDLFETQRYTNLTKAHSGRALIGHTRHGTVGRITTANAHPFVAGSIVGAHNGTIRGKQKGDENFGTDSECLYHNINEHGLAETIAETDGAWCLTFFDFATNTLNFLRNNERSLYLAADDKNETLFWASEIGMLSWILGRNGIKHQEIIPLKPDTLLQFDLMRDDWTNSVVTAEVKGKEVTKSTNSVVPFREPWTGNYVYDRTKAQQTGTEATATTGSGSTTSHVQRGTTTVGLSETTTNSGTHSQDISTTTSQSKIVTVDGYKGARISLQKHLQNLDAGCAFCGCETLYKDPIEYVSKTEFLCLDCSTAPDAITRVAQIQDALKGINLHIVQ